MRRLAGLFTLALLASCSTAKKQPTPPPSPDWPMYGHDAAHSFSASSSNIDASNVGSLKLAWKMPVSDAVTASPTVVGGVVYVGGWDGVFYAIDGASGAVKWSYEIDCQNSILPIPPRCLPSGMMEPDRTGTDGGLIVSSAAVIDGKVYFAGGRTVYCLDAASGALVWKHVVCGNPDDAACASDANDPTLVFSSPVVVNGLVVLGHTVDGANGYRGGIVGLDQATGNQKWSFEVDPLLDPNGKIVLDANGNPKGQNRGCGAVWSSGAIDAADGLVFFGTGDCQSDASPPYHEALLALDVASGKIAWTYRPRTTDTCDFDFGASANVITMGADTRVGIGAKDGTYYLLEAKTGALVWKQRVVFGGSSGGFIGTAAFDGKRVYGGTGLGELGGMLCTPSDPTDMMIEDPSFHALDLTTGAVVWEASKAYSFGPTTVTNDVVLNGVGDIVPGALRAYDAASGQPLASFPADGAVTSGATVVGKQLFFGAGNSFDGQGGAVFAYQLP